LRFGACSADTLEEEHHITHAISGTSPSGTIDAQIGASVAAAAAAAAASPALDFDPDDLLTESEF
jgi:hypothetical protein